VSLASASVIAWHLSGGPGPVLDPLLHRAVGQVLATQTLSLLKPGGRVMVITRDTAAFQNPASDTLLAGFQSTLAKAGVKTDSLQTLQVDPLRPVAVPAGDFFQWIKGSSKGSVIVSLMGPPLLDDTQTAQLGEVKPAIVAFCPGPVRDRVDLRELFVRGLLQAAVVSKRPVGVQKSAQLTQREAFDRQYLEVTAANLASLSTPPNLVP
jgi:hypothetical protein